MAHQHYQIYATDSLIKRNRLGRNFVFGLWILLNPSIIISLSGKIIQDWVNLWWFGFFIGLAIAVVIFTATMNRFIVQVGAMRAFVTIDQLRTFLGSYTRTEDDKAYVIYGPGFHISYPWESREANRNVPLEEVSESFTVDVQTPKGNLKVKGSVRLRPDITRVIPFLGGVAVMANDITDLIKSEIISRVSQKQTIVEALSSVAELTTGLTDKFGKRVPGSNSTEDSAGIPPEEVDEKVSDFENRFGVSVGDVTISEMLPSAELQKTMSGITEGEIIANGAAIILGYKNMLGVRRAITKGTLSQEDYNKARDRFMAASDNIKMNLDANEYTVKVEGLDPEVARAVTAIAPVLMGMSKGKSGRKGKQSG